MGEEAPMASLAEESLAKHDRPAKSTRSDSVDAASACGSRAAGPSRDRDPHLTRTRSEAAVCDTR